MRRVVGGLVVALVSVLSSAGAQELSLSGSGTLGCGAASGEFIAFLVPMRGIVLLANQQFPGGSQVGTVRDGRLQAKIPGYGSLQLASQTDAGTVIWGMFDRSLEIGDRSGCFVFDSFRWSDVDDLKTYVHWGVRDVLAEIPLDAVPAAYVPPLVKLAERRVTVEIVTPDHRTLRIRGVEGATLGYRPTDSETTFFFQPFVLGPGPDRAAVRVSSKRGEYFGPGITEELAFVVISEDGATTLPTDPPLALRLAGVEVPPDTEEQP